MQRRKKHKKRKKTIRQQILSPFIGIVLLMPLLIIVTFNIAINLYVDKTTKNELLSTRNNAYSLMKAAITSNQLHYSTKTDNATVNDTAQLLVSALTASRLSGNTEFLLLYLDNIVYPKNLNNEFRQILRQLRVNTIPSDDNVHIRKADDTSYYIMATKLTGYKDFPDVTMVFLSNTSASDKLIHTLNIFLLIIIFIITLTAIWIFLKISRKISRPITYSAMVATKIGQGDFVTMPLNYSCEETYRLSSSLNDMSRRLKEAEKVQKQFLQNASHELRTPLMSIQGYAEGIEKNVVSDVTGAATIIKSESIRMKRLVDELLTLSRIENQSVNIKLIDVNITNLLLDFIQSVQGMAMKKNISIETYMEDVVMAIVDENLLSQLIINIISNCIRYAKKRVLVTAKNMGDVATICIIDDGDGFNEDDVEHIFDRFYKGKNGNFGLGLAIANSAAKYMKASIKASNNEGGGAKFEITFRKNKGDATK